ncbi:hypothetical protein GMMP15_580040 [Candidatus Magnetomoraceae bacterium gMMP-15]
MNIDKKSKKTLWIIIFLFILIITGYNIYSGATVKKIGIPGIFEIEFGNKPSDTLPAGKTFTGTWQGTDPKDGSMITLSLKQKETELSGYFKDSFFSKPIIKIRKPGFEGHGSGKVLSDGNANMTFTLSRSDGKKAEVNIVMKLFAHDDFLQITDVIANDKLLNKQPITLQRR